MSTAHVIGIREAVTPGDVDMIRVLFREYHAAVGVDLCFQGFDNELRGLPGDYAPPGGALFLANVNEEAAGCVALRPLQDGACEMKRLYVRPAFRSFGLGRRLTERVITAARSAGYQFLCLDTLPIMESAQRLYESLGFVDVAPYRVDPVPGSRFMRFAL